MAVEIKDVEQVAQELNQKFSEFKEKNDKRLDAVEQEKGKLAGEVETLNGKLTELDNLKASLEEEIKSLKRPGGGTNTKTATEHKSAFMQFVRKGKEDGLRELEQKALNTGTDADGGYAVPEELDRTLLDILKDEVIMRQESTVITVGTSDYKKLVNLHGAGSG
ncbi:phage major capsid protein, partial [Yersinia enterocolitica]